MNKFCDQSFEQTAKELALHPFSTTNTNFQLGQPSLFKGKERLSCSARLLSRGFPQEDRNFIVERSEEVAARLMHDVTAKILPRHAVPRLT